MNSVQAVCSCAREKLATWQAWLFLKIHKSPAGPSIFLSPGDPEEKDKVRKAADCCRKILNHVNQAVKESENKQVINTLKCCSDSGQYLSVWASALASATSELFPVDKPFRLFYESHLFRQSC